MLGDRKREDALFFAIKSVQSDSSTRFITGRAEEFYAFLTKPTPQEVKNGHLYDLILNFCGEHKINVIKEIRMVASIGLKEAKDITEKSGSLILRGVSHDIAWEAKKKIDDQGASTTITDHKP